MMVLTSMLVGAPVAAQALDIPVVTPVQSKPSSVRLMVSAGTSGAPAGFTVERMLKVEYDALGGWSDDASSLVRGSFTGVPSFNIEGTADDYTLASGERIEVELGQLFDETGVAATDVEELAPSTEYVIRIRANGVGAGEPGAFTDAIVVGTLPLAANCTHTIGYWKNHEDQWPVLGLTLGNTFFSNAQLLLILNEPAQGNKLLILAHQLIAAKLSIANGADPSAAAATITLADLLIGALLPPPIGSDDLPENPATAYANLLDDFNNGVIGPGHCGTVPATPTTWGSMKSLYHE
jgi:hypothetical protein